MSVQGNRKGFFEEVDPASGKVVRENETFTCGHCQHVVYVPHGAQLGDGTIGEFCLTCMAPICTRCHRKMVAIGKCIPFQKKLDRLYARQRLFAALGI